MGTKSTKEPLNEVMVLWQVEPNYHYHCTKSLHICAS